MLGSLWDSLMVALPVVRVQDAVPRVEVGFAVIAVAPRFTDGAHNDRAKRRVGAEVRRLHADFRGHFRVDDRDRRRHVAWVNDVGSVGQQRRAAAIHRAVNVDAVADRTLLNSHVQIVVHAERFGSGRRRLLSRPAALSAALSCRGQQEPGSRSALEVRTLVRAPLSVGIISLAASTVTVVVSAPTVSVNAGTASTSPACSTIPVISFGWKLFAATFTV